MIQEYEGLTEWQERKYRVLRWTGNRIAHVAEWFLDRAYDYLDRVCQCEQCAIRRKRERESARVREI